LKEIDEWKFFEKSDKERAKSLAKAVAIINNSVNLVNQDNNKMKSLGIMRDTTLYDPILENTLRQVNIFKRKINVNSLEFHNKFMDINEALLYCRQTEFLKKYIDTLEITHDRPSIYFNRMKA
jgi:hypothetical protein